MTTKAEDLLKVALELPDDDRAELAGKLIRSLEPEAEDNVEAAWSEEIARRIAAIDRGEAQFVT
ncbi:MAG: addiction module protein, partial [Thermoanaerobaculia bacterium]